MMKRIKKICPVCGSTSVTVFLEIKKTPVHCNILWKKREDAINASRGDIKLGFCGDCGHVFNTAFESQAVSYSTEYENSLHFSPYFQDYARTLASRLIERHRLIDKDIIEIGCGKGDFLMLMSELGGNRGVGFDTSFEEERLCCSDNITFVKDLYSCEYSHYKSDMVLSRQVLEHLDDPRAFMEKLRSALKERPGTVLFFEVPNFLHTIKELAIWDIIYEHYSYFTPLSMRRLFSRGFRVDKVEEDFEGQFLCMEAYSVEPHRKRTSVDVSALEALQRDITAFSLKYAAKVMSWRTELERITARGQQAVVWSGGSKGVSFLNAFRAFTNITHAVDINPHKQGKFIPGTGHEIVPPEALKEISPDLVIVMNPVYTGEIWEKVKEMGIKCRILTA